MLEWIQGTVGPLLATWQWEAVMRMMICATIGGIIGIERELHGRAAGLRTHLLVCLGCGIVMLASNHFVRAYEHLGADSIVRLDPARLAYGVVAGIGFLGAGVIMKHGLTAHGLTTAASLWCTSSVGLAVGLGMYVISIVGAGIMLFGLMALRSIDRLLPSHHYFKLHVTHDGQDRNGQAVQEAIEACGGTVLSVGINWNHDDGVTASYVVRISAKNPDKIRQATWESVVHRCQNVQRVHLDE